VLRRLALPRGRALAGVAIFGALNFAGAFGFAYYALVHIEAGVASTLLALTPLVTLAAAVLHRQERLRADGLVGGAIALAGVAIISEASLSGTVPVLAIVAALASVVCFAEAAVVVRRFPPVAPVMTNAVAMGVGAALLLALSVAARETWTVPHQRETWLALAYLVLVGSVVVFLLYVFVLRHWEASRAVYFDVLIPPSALALSACLDEEPISMGVLLGGGLVVIGAYLGAIRHTDQVMNPLTTEINSSISPDGSRRSWPPKASSSPTYRPLATTRSAHGRLCRRRLRVRSSTRPWPPNRLRHRSVRSRLLRPST
jgi:drug/metabolite transporter (DMT)-like permease